MFSKAWATGTKQMFMPEAAQEVTRFWISLLKFNTASSIMTASSWLMQTPFPLRSSSSGYPAMMIVAWGPAASATRW